MSVDELRLLPWAKAGVARIHSSRLGITLQFGPYVGRLTIPGSFTIDLLELVPGTLRALAPLSLQGRRWIASTGQVGSTSVEPWVVVAELFVRALEDYLQRGIQREYMPRQYDGSRPRGTLNVRRSINRYWGRNRLDRVSTDVRWLTEDTPINRLAISAAVRAEHLLLSEPKLLLSLRRGIRAMAGVPVLAAPDVRAAQTHDDVDSTLVDLAVLLIRGITGLPDLEEAPQQPVDVWFDVARVFEGAVRRLVSEKCAPGMVRNGTGDGVSLFATVSGREYDADPDVVVDLPDQVAILDAKYREHGADVSREEIYQLMAHAVAYRARHAALVVPRLKTSDQSYEIGEDRDGRSYSVIVIEATDPTRAQAELERWLAPRGFLPQPSPGSWAPSTALA